MRSELKAALDVALMPIFGLAAITSGLAMLAALAAMAAAFIFLGNWAWLGAIWGFFAACIAIYNAHACIQAMNTGSWRALGSFLGLSFLALATCPFLWPGSPFS